jgi:putative effector of murein hydrolase LrgA (UPF0299 family)
MEELGKQIESLYDSAVEYGKTTIELTRLKAIDKISDVVSKLLTKIVAAVILGMVFLFVSLGLAFWLGEVFGKVYLGFFAVAGFYALIALVIGLFLGKWVNKLICNYLIREVLH